MVTAYREAPLLFLTTSNASAPTGRNARAQARSESARRTNPAAARGGSFGSFSINVSPVEKAAKHSDDHRNKRQKTEHSDDGSKRNDGHEKQVAYPNASIRILATHFNQRSPPLPPNVNFEDVLKVASFHIRRQAAQIVQLHPHRTLEALRCRQWCSVSSTSASLGRSPYLDSAIACVVSKVQQVISGSTSQQKMLFCYTEALHLLRAAVLQPKLQDKGDMLAATQLLAIYEMMDFPENAFWTQHVAGAAAMAKALGSAGEGDSMQAAPMFVEALLNDDEAFFGGQHWRSLLHVITTKPYPDPEMRTETISCFTTLRSIFADSHAAARKDADWSTRFELLSRAHELRELFMLLIVDNKERFLEARKTSTASRGCDVLGLCLVSVMAMDKLILSLRQNNWYRGTDIEHETRGLCTLMVGLELNTTDFHPSKDLLRAFQRQVNYPSLTYDV
ncbi:hypothetical protein PRZ48_006682 [Zasmidium cellare]|uniref:Uncharacterized protein n=1 Tax=Zasmidium cellare TaxID=395010 RepID=A0ABR0ENR3_ZASCE|nr:hypothetical protein PRZ48_006682 [Zasmidium cellare]